MSQKPATRSLVPLKGPLVTVRSLPQYLMRAPFELGCRPSPASMTPAFTISSLNLPMAVSNSVLGMTPASLFLSAFTITMNRIVTLHLISIRQDGCEPGVVNKTNAVLRARHFLGNYFGNNCGAPEQRPGERSPAPSCRWLPGKHRKIRFGLL